MDSDRNPRPLSTSNLPPTSAESGRLTPARLAACRLWLGPSRKRATATDITVSRMRTPQLMFSLTRIGGLNLLRKYPGLRDFSSDRTISILEKICDTNSHLRRWKTLGDTCY